MMYQPRPNLEPHEPMEQEPCICGLNHGERITCIDCSLILCEECEREACSECREIVCPRHLRTVLLAGTKATVCGICYDRLLEEGEACDCDSEDCEVCREQARRTARQQAEREAEDEGRLADQMVEVLGDV